MDLNLFLRRYFEAHKCRVSGDDRIIQVELTETLDRVLMNRPFYWQYMKSTGMKGQPLSLSLITDPQLSGEGERIHFGSPRLQQIFSHLQENEQYTRQYEIIQSSISTPVYPWLAANVKIIYRGLHLREEFFSIGLNLVNGQMKTDMMGLLKPVPFSHAISDQCYPISPVIKLESGFQRIEKLLVSYIEKQDHSWAAQSLRAMEEEISLLKHFYDSHELESMEKEIEDISMRFKPSIALSTLNAGLFYMGSDFA